MNATADTDPPQTPTEAARPIEDKWGTALSGGFVVIPAVLIKYQYRLGITAEELVVLLNLFLSWRETGDKPYPRTATLGRRMDVAARTVQRRLASLERKKLIRREWGLPQRDGTRTVTRYDVTGIVKQLQDLGLSVEVFEARNLPPPDRVEDHGHPTLEEQLNSLP